jgi:transcriptional regulator with XRE-family HTH domain
MHLGEQIRNVRRGHFMTLDALAQAAGVTKGFISQVESGKSNPSLASLQRIAKALGVTLANLVDSNDAGHELDLELGGAPVPHLVAARSVYNEQPGLTQLAGFRAGSHFMANIPPMASLVYDDQPAPRLAAMALCTVLHGGLGIRQASLQTKVSAGEIASWNAGAPYEIENAGSTTASALIFLPAGCQLPSVRMVPHAPLSPPSRGGFATQYEGPMRLVGMRARRQIEEGR